MTQEREMAMAIAAVVKSVTGPMLVELTAMRERVAVLEARAPVPGPQGQRGEKGERGDPGESGEPGEPGIMGQRGSDGKPGDTGIQGARGERGEKGEPGIHGKDGIAGLNGKDGTDGLVGKDGLAGLNGVDGVGVMDALLDHQGHLIVTLSDGRMKDVGPVIGNDGTAGKDGADGRDVDPVAVQERIDLILASWPKPANGKDGMNGTDGLSLEDFDWDFDAQTRAFTIKLIRGGAVVVERTKTLKGLRIYRGVYEAGKSYEEGDVVSWDGSEWNAMAATSDRPGNGATPWKMAVKHGKDGARGAEGKPGRDGKDLSLTHAGTVWTEKDKK